MREGEPPVNAEPAVPSVNAEQAVPPVNAEPAVPPIDAEQAVPSVAHAQPSPSASEALQARLDEVICVPLLDRNPAGGMQVIRNCFTSCDGTAGSALTGGSPSPCIFASAL